MVKYSVLVPFFNEEEVLKKNVVRIYNQLKSEDYDFELILVNDSSTDNSLKIAKNLEKRYSQVSVISYDNGPSRRENLYWSFFKTNGDIIAFTDSDLPVHEKNFSRLFNTLKSPGCDICIGSKYEPGSKSYRGLFRRILSICYNKTIHILFGGPVNDYQCGFKAFKRQSILKLVKESGYDKSFTRGCFFDAEILIRAFKQDMKIVAIPVVWRGSKKTSLTLSREMKIFIYLFHFWRKI